MITVSSGDALSLSETVFQEVAEQMEVPPEALNSPLYDVIDPEALDTIFRADTGHISFEYHGYLVTVSHSGKVTVEPPEAD